MPQQPAQAASESAYTGALDGFKDKVDLDNFDSLSYTHKRFTEAPLKMTFRATNAKQIESWQKSLRTKVTELIGGFPTKRTPLNAQTLEVKEFADYRREKFVFESRPGLFVLGYLLTPREARAPSFDDLPAGPRPRRRRHRRHR